MSRPEIWVSVTCSDRAASLRALATDVAEQAARCDVAVRLLIQDNSVQAAERAANQRLAATLARGVIVDLEVTPRAGASIAASRRLQREQVRRQLAAGTRPAFVWMLDDDIRLTHIQWTGTFLDERPLHCHVAFLLDLAKHYPRLELLVGEVCGDAPIPIVGSLASRLHDLACSLWVMLGADPDAPWCVGSATLARLAEPDAHYDLSHQRSAPARGGEILWLPRGAPLNTAAALTQLLAEVEHVPRGAAFTRPVLAAPSRFAQLVERPLRGANAVFYDVDRCIQHEYPAMVVGGIDTRRSDMIGTTMLASAGASVRGSGFSVLHRRPRDTPWPTRGALESSLIADTLGAWLARHLDPKAADRGEFLEARIARLHASARAVAADSLRLRRIAESAPSWAPSLAPALAVAEWAAKTFPGGDTGALPDELVDALRAGVAAEVVRT